MSISTFSLFGPTNGHAIFYLARTGYRSGGQSVGLYTHTYAREFRGLQTESFNGGHAYGMMIVEKGDKGPAGIRVECLRTRGGTVQLSTFAMRLYRHLWLS
jgi:hypothetical protein